MIARRSVLSTIASGGFFVSIGCLGDAGEDRTDTPSDEQTPTETTSPTADPTGDGYVSPTGSPVRRASYTCESEVFERMRSWVEDGVVWGNLTDDTGPVFELRASSRSIALEDAVTITLRNVSESPQTTGNVHKSNLSILTEDGWVDVRGWADGQTRPITDDVREFDPNEAYVWEFPMTTDGVIEMSYPNHRESLAVCPSLQPGRYRFATGAVGEQDRGVAVSFDVTDDG